MIYTDPRFPRVEFTIQVEQDDQPVRGNLIASGDDEADRKDEDEVLRRLDQGDVWAWAVVKVTARVETEQESFEGHDYLGGCDYENEADFVHSSYFDDMKFEAARYLINELRLAVERGTQAKALYYQLSNLLDVVR